MNNDFLKIDGKMLEPDFVDFGASRGGSISYGISTLGGKVGVGIDIDPVKVNAMKELGLPCIHADATASQFPAKSFRFAIVSHFLEHLPELQSIADAVKLAINVSREFVFIQGPFFDADEWLRERSLKYFYSDWRGHRYHLKTWELQQVLEDIGIENYLFFGVFPTKTSSDPFLHPIESPPDQQKYNGSTHPPKLSIDLIDHIYKEFVCVIRIEQNLSVEAILRRVGDSKQSATLINPTKMKLRFLGNSKST